MNTYGSPLTTSTSSGAESPELTSFRLPCDPASFVSVTNRWLGVCAGVKARGLLRREQEDLGVGVIGHTATIRLPGQPFAHAPLLETRAVSKLTRRQRPTDDERPIERELRNRGWRRHGAIVTVLRQATAKNP